MKFSTVGAHSKDYHDSKNSMISLITYWARAQEAVDQF